MSKAVLAGNKQHKSAAGSALSAAAALWFLTMVIGQLIFLYDIAAFYGSATLSGNLETWNANRFLRMSYAADDKAGCSLGAFRSRTA